MINGKDWINNHRVYVVNFFSSQQTGSAGTLYIDTASYAFVRIAYTSYHIKRAMMIDIDKSSNVIDYQQRGGRWYLKATETNILANRNKFDLFKFSSFRTEDVETEAVEPIAYQDRLPDNMEDIGIGKTATSTPEAVDTAIKQRFAPTTLPSIETTPPVKTTFVGRLNLLERFRNYVLKDNIRVRYGISSLPVMVNGNQPLLGRNTSSVNNYAFYTNTSFRLLNSKALFFQYEHLFNLGIPRLKSSGEAYGFSYDLQLNRTGHPITFSPSFGISTLDIGKKKAVYLKQKSIYYGISFTYEISPRTGWFIAGKYDDVYNMRNTGLYSKRQAISAAAGFTFKLKT